MEKETFFDEICSKFNIDSHVKKNAHKQLAEINRTTILQGDQKHWICCAIFTACSEMKIPTINVPNLYVQGNGVSLVKLINECHLDIFSFFEKIEIWFKVASVPNAIQEKIENLKRNFRLSLLAYEEYSKMFRKLFACKDTVDETPSKTPSKGSRKKQIVTPYTTQKLFEMCWTLFVAVKSEFPEISGDFVSSINGLLCCMDCVFHNILHDNRRDLINSTFPGLPRTFFSPSFDAVKASPINIIGKLCSDSGVETHKYLLKIRCYITEKALAGDFNTIFSIDNYDGNFKKLNDFYETFILSCGQFDERIYLSHPDFGSKFFGKSSSVQSNSQGESFIPQTPLSGQDLSHHSATKLSPVSSYRQNVQKLQALYSGGIVQPPNALKELLICLDSDTILVDLKARLDRMKEIFVTKMMPNGQDRFHIAEALYYRLLENIINSERKTHGRFDLFIKDDLFNETLIILCLEIVLFAFSLHKKLPTLLECFNIEAFHFYKLIEVAIRNNKDYFTNDMIKHLKAIEEQCLDSLVWVSGSALWKMVEEQNGKLPASQDAEAPLSSDSPNNQAPKSLKLFSRKFYQLAHLRLKDLCKNLQFTNNTDLLQKIWTLFQYAITDHIHLMKDRHLDQNLMCCVYVLCKIRPNENRHTFADIMKFYRSQPQADSHIYRSVFIEYIADTTNGAETGNARNTNAAEPEVVSGRSTVYGTESRGDIIYFYNKIFVPKMQAFAMSFSTSSQNNLLLSPLPHTRPLISPRKISPYHDVYVQPMTKQSILSPSARTLTFTIEQSPSKDLQKINSLINKDRKAAVAKRFNMDTDSDFPPNKMSKELLLLNDREEVHN